jgi:hypothetical protein
MILLKQTYCSSKKLKNRQINLFFSRFFKREFVTQLRSSETKREAPFDSNISQSNQFDFSEFLLHCPPETKLSIKVADLEWLIGFIEGDGTLYFREDPNINSASGTRICFEIGQKDLSVLERIKRILGFGQLNSYSITLQDGRTETYWQYRVEKREHLVLILQLLNGNLVLPKRRNQFSNWVEVFRRKKLFPKNFKNQNSNLSGGCAKVSLDNGWLSGFIDADGGFYALISKKQYKSKPSAGIRQKFFITQKNEFDDKQVLLNIRTLVKSPVNLSQVLNAAKNKSRIPLSESPYFRVEIQSLESHELLLVYLNRFKLKTSKLIAFRRWERVVKARREQLHLDLRNFEKLKKLCESINKCRK